MYYKYNGELGPPAASSYYFFSQSDPYLDGNVLSFKGVGLFMNGLLSGGPAFFINGNGYSHSFSWMHNGRPAPSS